MVCTRCIGTGEIDSHAEKPVVIRCPRCLGLAWLWSDGRPATICPGGAAIVNLITGHHEALPCGRRHAQCPGCDRDRADIGNDDDITRTLNAQPPRTP